jgi:hypothetical protein
MARERLMATLGREARLAIALPRAHGEVARVRRRINRGFEHRDVHFEKQRVQLLVARLDESPACGGNIPVAGALKRLALVR